MKKNSKNFIVLTFIMLFVWGCETTPAVPHVFMSSYEPISDEYFSDYENTDNALYSVTGSGFLRQVGGGIVNCAGNPVNAVPVMPSTAYGREVDALNWRVRGVSTVDSNYVLDKARLAAISRSAYCDVDGKFEISGMTPGIYTISTEISWVIPKICGSGAYSYRCDSKQGGIRSTNVSILNNPDKTEYKVIISQ